MGKPRPTIETTAVTIGQLLEDIVNRRHSHCIVVACCTRRHVYDQLRVHFARKEAKHRYNHLADFHEIPSHNVESRPLPSANYDTGTTADMISSPAENTPKHLLEEESAGMLSTTLETLLSSQNITVAYCTSLLSFRAFIPTILSHHNLRTSPCAELLLVDVVALHHGTSDFTLQGLAKTFASIASVSQQLNGRVRLVDCIDANDASNSQRGPHLWNAEIPMLSNSIRIRDAGQAWASRTSSVKSLADRWFQIE